MSQLLRIATLTMIFTFTLVGVAAPAPSYAEEQSMENILPEPVSAQIKVPLQKVGEGNYRKLGFKIYHATLWAPDGVWDAKKPFALHLKYARDLSKDTLMDAIMDDIREQGVADEATMNRWQDTLGKVLPEIHENDVIIGLCIPGKKSQLYFNGKSLITIDDKAFSDAFFNIWFGPHANESLRKNLLGQDNG